MFGFAPDKAATPLPTLYIIEVILMVSLLVSAHWYMRINAITVNLQRSG